MANIMQMFRAKNKVSRNAFDLSKKNAFTADAGELLPVYSRVCMPGDRFNIRCAWKSRTMPVNTAAFTRFKEYFDWYFVPFDLLWNKYNTWSTNMKENNMVASSINGSTQITDRHPYFDPVLFSNAVSQQGWSFSTNRNQNAFGFDRGPLTAKLLHMLGYGDWYQLDGADQPWFGQIRAYEMSPWRLLAYQKIYQDWYRNTQWESASPETYNIDYMDGAENGLSIPLNEIDHTKLNMFDLQYASWNKDMFMGVLPNSQYGDAASVMSMGFFASTGDTNSEARFVANSDVNLPKVHDLVSGFGQTNYGGDLQVVLPVSNFSILALRQAEVLQKFREIQQSNSQDFPSQTEAHYGFRPSEAYSRRCIRIGGYDGVIEIQDIDNTNITENEDGSLNAADIAGKGVSRGEGNLADFVCPTHGLIMCIYHIKPLLDYALTGIAPDNVKTAFTDYAIPEFDKTGMVQVPLSFLTNRKNLTWDYVVLNDDLLGYAPNYFDYKTDVDEVHGAFYNGGLESWVSPITRNYIDSYLENAGSLTTITGGTQWEFTGINHNFFKINPSVLDSIFATDADGEVSSDKFLVNCYFDIKAVRPLDVDGLPY